MGGSVGHATGAQLDLRFDFPLQQPESLNCPDRPRVLRYQGVDGQQGNTLDRRLCH